MELVGLCDNIFVFNNMYKFVIKIKYILLFLFFKVLLLCIVKKKLINMWFFN